MSKYYVHRKGTFVGNAPLFWAKGGSGYTSYVLGAERFSEEEAIKLYESDKNKWEIFKCDEIDRRLHLVFDYQDKNRLGTDEPCGWNSGYAPDAKDLQQRLALKDLENLRLREALTVISERSIDPPARAAAQLTLSTPPQREDLDAYVEAQQGEPVAWALFYDNGIVHHVTKYVPPTMNGSHLGYKPLYTAPPQPQTVKDALEKALTNVSKLKPPKNYIPTEIHAYEQAHSECWKVIRELILDNEKD